MENKTNVGIFLFFCTIFILTNLTLIEGNYNPSHGEEYLEEIQRNYFDLSYPLNINEATVKELSEIDGVNKKHASLIVKYRKKIGVITDLHLLVNIKGIGPATFNRIARNTFVSFKDQPLENGYLQTETEEYPEYQENPKIDLNQANWQMIKTIKGIGEKTAKSIVNYREKGGKLTDFSQLSSIKGLGPKRIKSLKDKFYIK